MVLVFRLTLRPGVPVYQQVVYAAKKAIIAGQMLPGERFPSVRTISQELKINPNTAHKVVTQLISEGLLEVHPGLGTVVANLPASRARERALLLKGELESLVVEAKKLQMTPEEVQAALLEHWDRLTSDTGERSVRRGKGEKV
jgi:GntR family transcriptional regulator